MVCPVHIARQVYSTRAPSVQRFLQTLIIQDGQVLLGRWHEGMFAGKLTGCLGATLSADESLCVAARRIVRSLCQIDLEPTRLQPRAHFVFQEMDQSNAVATAFGTTYGETQLLFDAGAAPALELQPERTPAFEPMWFDFDDVPFDQMPEDDAVWYPSFLRGAIMCGEFKFDGTRLVSHNVTECSAAELEEAIAAELST